MNDALEFLKSAGVFCLATLDRGLPRMRPFGAVCGFEGRLYIVTTNDKPVYQQLKADGNAEICACSGGAWIRIDGELQEDLRREARLAMLEANPDLKAWYSADDGKMAVFFFRRGTASVYPEGAEKPEVHPI